MLFRSGVARSYSFATPAQPNAQVSFFVRQVPQGVFSGHVHTQPLVGQRVSVQGPAGDFWLRPGEGPLLCVAGGSGLAPLLALLQGALDSGVQRPVRLVFGARTQADLYALDEIAALAQAWPLPFDFVPVLSQEPEGSDWPGARGLVTLALGARPEPATQAYLCGPPAMVDAVEAHLVAQGVARADIHADRFTTLHDQPAAPSRAA